MKRAGAFQQPSRATASFPPPPVAARYCIVSVCVCTVALSLLARDQKGPFLRVVVVKVVKSYPSNTREPTRARERDINI